MIWPDYKQGIEYLMKNFVHKARPVHPMRWQGIDISKKPEMATYELLHPTLQVQMRGYEGNNCKLVNDINPAFPWAEDHFQERVCGQPINPGVQWKKWPFGQSAAKFLERGMFNHNYMERYWPKRAGSVFTPTETPEEFITKTNAADYNVQDQYPLRGIRYEYGDLNDVVQLLAADPYTRQAFLPMWFPEDTGGGSKRAPCTLGYLFIMRENRLDITYYIRSCDLNRHFADDVYLTHRLAEWMLEQVQLAASLKDDFAKSALWKDVHLGVFTMHMTSLHVFKNDWRAMFPNDEPPQ